MEPKCLLFLLIFEIGGTNWIHLHQKTINISKEIYTHTNMNIPCMCSRNKVLFFCSSLTHSLMNAILKMMIVVRIPQKWLLCQTAFAMNLVAIWQSLHTFLQTLGNVHWSTGSGVDDSECNGQFLTVIAQTEHLSLQTLRHAATISYLVHNPKLIHQDRQYLQLCLFFNQLRMFFIICYKFILPIVLMNALPFFKCLPLTLSQSSQHLVLLPLHIAFGERMRMLHAVAQNPHVWKSWHSKKLHLHMGILLNNLLAASILQQFACMSLRWWPTKASRLAASWNNLFVKLLAILCC